MSDRRCQKLVDRFQYKLIVRMVSYWFIYQLTLWNFLFCWQLLHTGGGNIFEQYTAFLRESSPMLICFVLLVPAFAWDAVRFYHRIAGPIVRFRRTARDIAADRPVRPIRLREGDELEAMQDDFNAMLDGLASRGAVSLIQDRPVADAAASHHDGAEHADEPMAIAASIEERRSHGAG